MRTKEQVAEIVRLRGELLPAPSAGECLGTLLDKCIPRFFELLPVYGFVLTALLWLAAGDHRPRGWLALLGGLGVFALLYMYLIRQGRYMIDHVDLGLFLALSAVAAGMLRREAMERERVLGAVALALAVLFSFLLCRGSFRQGKYSAPEAQADGRAAVERILADSEHLYLAKLDSVADAALSPFETAAAGYCDRIVLLGGWDFGHPVVADTLAEYGVVNPYRDIVDNDRVYIIEDDIESTLEYIRDYYHSGAQAQLAEPISSQTGLEIYRIVGGGEAGA